MKRFLILILFVSTVIWLPRIAKIMTQGFRVSKLHIDLPFQPEWEVPIDPAMIEILNQPFHYLGQGAQSFVFESEDGKYVVKFFRFDKRLFKKLSSVCSGKKEKQRTPTLTKAFTVFNASKIAYDCLKEETGLVYLHLNATSLGLPILRCQNPIGRTFLLPLDSCRFAVQKKAILFSDALSKALQNPEEMKKRIDQLIDLLRSRTAKGVFNTDPTLVRNFGFLEDRAVEIDFGNYRSAAVHDQIVEVKRYTDKLRVWLELEAPEWVEYLDHRMQGV